MVIPWRYQEGETSRTISKVLTGKTAATQVKCDMRRNATFTNFVSPNLLKKKNKICTRKISLNKVTYIVE